MGQQSRLKHGRRDLRESQAAPVQINGSPQQTALYFLLKKGLELLAAGAPPDGVLRDSMFAYASSRERTLHAQVLGLPGLPREGKMFVDQRAVLALIAPPKGHPVPALGALLGIRPILASFVRNMEHLLRILDQENGSNVWARASLEQIHGEFQKSSERFAGLLKDGDEEKLLQPLIDLANMTMMMFHAAGRDMQIRKAAEAKEKDDAEGKGSPESGQGEGEADGSGGGEPAEAAGSEPEVGPDADPAGA